LIFLEAEPNFKGFVMMV